MWNLSYNTKQKKRKCFFDIETCFDPTSMDSFKPVLVVLEFETACFGNMSRITFGDRKMKNPGRAEVEPDIAQNDYCGPDLPNLLAPSKLNPRFRSRSRCWPKAPGEAWNQRVGLTSEEVREESARFLDACHAGYQHNQKRFEHIVEADRTCMFDFFCWILQPSFHNSAFIAPNRFLLLREYSTVG